MLSNFPVRYVTEKFWKSMSRNVVPIVMGGADYDSIAPPHSFINVMDYKSPKVEI